MSAILDFTYRSVKSALRLYFEPLDRIRGLVRVIKKNHYEANNAAQASQSNDELSEIQMRLRNQKEATSHTAFHTDKRVYKKHGGLASSIERHPQAPSLLLRSDRVLHPYRVFRPERVRVGILCNMRAGRSDTQIPRLRAFLQAHPHVVHAETHHPDAVPEALAELAQQEVDLLVVCGGDGTFQHVLTEILRQRFFGDRVPMLAPVRGGSTNMTALDIGAQRDPIKGVADVIKALEEGRLDERLCQRHVLHVTSKEGDVDQYGMFFGTGWVYHGIEQAKRSLVQGHMGSPLILGGLIVKRFYSKNDGRVFSDRFTIRLDGEPVEDEDYNLVMTSTLHRLISGIRPFWGTEPAPVRFTAVAARARHFGLAVPNLLRGKPNERITAEKGYISHNIHQAELLMDSGFTIDGELHAPKPNRTLIITANDYLKFVRA